MRALADDHRIHRFMRALGAAATADARVYFTGGATAVLLGWRPSTIDVDIRIVPEHDALFRALPDLKEKLQILPASLAAGFPCGSLPMRTIR